MSGLFEKPKQNRCEICQQQHSHLTLCKHDNLVQMIKWQRKHLIGLHRANTEAVSMAKIFQKLIREIEPKLARMAEFIFKAATEPIANIEERDAILADLGFKKVDGKWAREIIDQNTNQPQDANSTGGALLTGSTTTTGLGTQKDSLQQTPSATPVDKKPLLSIT